jgi:hypothetical protein
VSTRTTLGPGRRRVGLDRLVALLLAFAAAVWHALLMTRATNDNFLHLSLAQQWLHGDWPVRDFFDQGWVLQYTLSAAAMLLFGARLGAEAIVVGVCWAVSTYLVFRLVRRLTASTLIAATSAVMLIVASARGYSYPKGIVYAVAATLWWGYIDRPSQKRALLFGAWAAVAFYWRPDHGLYVAAGLTLAMVAAHGVSGLAVTRSLMAAAVMIACLVPFFAYVQMVYGLVPYAQTGLLAAEVEHASQGTHEWPLLRYASQLVVIEPADDYAPVVGLRWRRDSTLTQREEVLSRYSSVGLTTDRDGVQSVRLSADAVARLRPLINEPLIDDTAGIDRSAGTITEKAWPASQRRLFNYRVLRVRILPMLDRQTRASEFTAALFFALPLVLFVTAPVVARGLTGVRPGALAAFAAFALLVAWAMVRNPFPARVADAVTLSSIVFGCCLGGVSHLTRRPVLRATSRLSGALAAVAVVWIVAVSGRFESPLAWLRDASDTLDELTASPPLQHYVNRPARFTVRLAAYVRDCVPSDDRLLVLWFEPEIYYYSDRLMALRHGVFAPAWARLPREQRETLAKVERFKPPLVLARQSALEEYARATYPGIIDYVMQQYTLATTIHDAGEDYLVYMRRDRPPVRTFAAQSWPCYTRESSRWASVGRSE